VRTDDELHELISAYLDEELATDERTDLEELLARSAAARHELDDLARVRATLRGLPEVEPPAGFTERLLATDDAGPEPSAAHDGRFAHAGLADVARLEPARRRRSSTVRRLGAMAAAAAAVVVVAAVTPVLDRVAPPVTAYAQRHHDMVVEPVAEPPLPEFEPVAEQDLATMPPPYAAPQALPSGYVRELAFRDEPDGVMHLVYARGDRHVSVFAQPGAVDWEALPEGGSMGTVGDSPMWAMGSEQMAMVVVERAAVVYVVVADGAHDEAMDVVDELPEPPAPSLADRASSVCSALLEQLGLGG
jgi:hypothetical protein